MRKKLDKILRPESVAVIGASDSEGSVGYSVMYNMLHAGFTGKVYPINIKHSTVQGEKAYPSVKKIDGKVDLAVICTPASSVPGIVKECGEAGVGGLVIISAGFKEAGEEGKKMYWEIKKLAKQYKIRVIGPNCLGFMNPHLGINATFAAKNALKGNIAFISQSGALLTSILDWSVEQSVGFSYFVSIGSMLDVGFADLIDYFGTDPHTACILIYMESIEDARKFMSAARSFSRNKPVIVLKAGKSEEGGQATKSHTGSLAGNDAVFDAAFRRAGVIRVDTIAQLFNAAQSLAMQPRPRGNRLAIVTNAGGPGVLATDYLVANGGQLAKLSDKTLEILDSILPGSWSHGNPVDVLGDAGEEAYRRTVDACLRDEGVDGVLVILTPQAMTHPSAIARGIVEINQVASFMKKPVLAAWMGESDVWEGREILENGKVPNYRYPESAVDVFVRMYKYARNLQLLYETVPGIPRDFDRKSEQAREIIYQALEKDRMTLTENEAKRLMGCYDIPVSRNKVTTTAGEAVEFANEIGYPVVMKVVSPDIGHKTEVGGVQLDLQDEQAVRDAFKSIKENVTRERPDARIEGVLVEQMIEKPFELLIGANKDPIFGPVIVFGRGGTAVEVYKDTQMGLPPLNMALARQIIHDTQIYPLLKGYRNMPGVNLEELEFTLVKFAYLVMDFPEIKEIDINPFVADEKGGIVLDAHIVLERVEEEKKARPYQHLSIRPYPGRYIREVTLKDGTKVTLRPIRPEDEPLMEKMLDYISTSSLYYRFFGYVPKVTHEWMSRFTHIDYDREIAIVAIIENEHGEEEMAGVVRIIEDAWGESAEYAILVADKWQGKGLGNILMDYIMQIARERRIGKIVASVLPTNAGMIHMFEKRGFKFDKSGLEIYEVELDLEGVEA
jgi:acetyltransferase